MPRGPRNLPTGAATFHVGIHANDKGDLFHEDRDKNVFKMMIRQAKKLFGFELYHYCLMCNHWHMIIRTNGTHSLSVIMKWLNQQYAIYHKWNYHYKGRLYDDAYWCREVVGEWDLMRTALYVDANPVGHDVCRLPGEYPWSSYSFYANGSIDEIVDMDPRILSLGTTGLADGPGGWREAYRAEMALMLWAKHRIEMAI